MGQKSLQALVSFPSAQILAKEITPTLPERGGQAVLDDTLALARRLRYRAENLGASVQGIGIGIAELVNLQGDITSEYLIRWQTLPVKDSHFADSAGSL